MPHTKTTIRTKGKNKRSPSAQKRKSDKHRGTRFSEAYYLFKRIFNHALDAILIVDDNLRYVQANPAACTLLGYSRNELLRMGVPDITPQEKRELVPVLWKEFIAAGNKSGEYALRCKDGAIRQAEFRAVANILPGLHLSILREITDRKRMEKALRESEEQFRAQYKGIPIPTYTWKRDGEDFVLVDHNDAARSRGQIHKLMGKTARELYSDMPDVLEDFSRCFSEKKPVRRELLYQFRSTNEKRHMAVWYTFVPPDLIMVHAEDISERKQMEEELQKSEERYRLIVETMTDVVYKVFTTEDDPFGGTVDFVSNQVENILGYRPDEFTADPGLWFRILRPEDLTGLVESSQKILASRQAGTRTYRLRHKETGDYRWIEDKAVPLMDHQGRLIGIQGSARDVTERKRTEEKLKNYTERLQSHTRELIELQERERRHIARELHDEIGQVLTGLKLALEMTTRLPPETVKDSLGDIQSHVDQLVERVRNLSLSLRPTMLDDLGLLPTLLWHIERYTFQTKIRVNFTHRSLETRFAPEVETAAYRIVQEALTNVARHAGVEEAKVSVWVDDGVLHAQVEDRGRGFDPTATATTHARGGLSGMRERAILLGGRFTVDSSPGAGTRLTAELPLNTGREPYNKR